jgi:acetyl esterase/lipase
VRERVNYTVGGSEAAAYVYRPPGEARRGALVFYIGVGPEHEHPDVVRIAEGLARAGVVVMLPVSPNLSEFRVSPNETEWVVAAFEWLRARPYVDPARVGMAGLSVGGSAVAVAAADPRIAGDVRLLQLFGAGYDARQLVQAVTLRRIEVDGEWRPWQPEAVSVDVLREMLLGTLPQADRAPLRPLFDWRTRETPAGLTPDGQAVARLLANRDPERAPALVAGLPPGTLRYLDSVSPRSVVGEIEAELLLLHDRADAIVPFTESRRFYAEARPARGKHLTELELFRHVEPQRGIGPLRLAREGSRMYAHLRAVLHRLA